MISVRSPFRVSFVGGGSDMESFFRYNEGSVISTSIDKYIYVNVNKKFDPGYRIAYSKVEETKTVDDIQHPLVKNCLKIGKIDQPLEISSIADIPGQGTGLGSSSSYTVGLILALTSLTKNKISKAKLAKTACEVEIGLCNEPIGMQDQFAAAFGGYNRFFFKKSGKVLCKKIKLKNDFKNYFESRWLVFFTGISRRASSILRDQQKLLKNRDTFAIQKQMVLLCDDFESALINEDFRSLAKILRESWLLKKRISPKISNQMIDDMYETAINSGALGGKLLGAGSGGFLFLLVPLSRRDKVIEALRRFRLFHFFSEDKGAKVIYRT